MPSIHVLSLPLLEQYHKIQIRERSCNHSLQLGHISSLVTQYGNKPHITVPLLLQNILSYSTHEAFLQWLSIRLWCYFVSGAVCFSSAVKQTVEHTGLLSKCIFQQPKKVLRKRDRNLAASSLFAPHLSELHGTWERSCLTRPPLLPDLERDGGGG